MLDLRENELMCGSVESAGAWLIINHRQVTARRYTDRGRGRDRAALWWTGVDQGVDGAGDSSCDERSARALWRRRQSKLLGVTSACEDRGRRELGVELIAGVM